MELGLKSKRNPEFFSSLFFDGRWGKIKRRGEMAKSGFSLCNEQERKKEEGRRE